jgi:hypothetical protein
MIKIILFLLIISFQVGSDTTTLDSSLINISKLEELINSLPKTTNEHWDRYKNIIKDKLGIKSYNKIKNKSLYHWPKDEKKLIDSVISNENQISDSLKYMLNKIPSNLLNEDIKIKLKTRIVEEYLNDLRYTKINKYDLTNEYPDSAKYSFYLAGTGGEGGITRTTNRIIVYRKSIKSFNDNNKIYLKSNYKLDSMINMLINNIIKYNEEFIICEGAVLDGWVYTIYIDDIENKLTYEIIAEDPEFFFYNYCILIKNIYSINENIENIFINNNIYSFILKYTNCRNCISQLKE